MKNVLKKESGFTLVELAIVLVIIGLIVGGVLVGQDLIKAATIRATVTDIEKYNAAATTFRGKYQGYPGDLSGLKATQFGFAVGAARSGTAPAAGAGDGNGFVEGCAAGATALGCETALFWADLSTAGLIPFHPTTTGATDTAATASLGNAALGGVYLPKTKLRDSALVTVFTNVSRNWYGIGTLTTGAAGAVANAAGLTPLEARGIDEKLDDGVPTTGIVYAIKTDLVTADTAAAAGPCIITGNTYIADTDQHLNAIGCSIAVRASF